MEVRNNKQLGEMGERVAIGELAKYGIDVLLPMSDNLPLISLSSTTTNSLSVKLNH